MPLQRAAYPDISVRIARILTLVARKLTRTEIAERFAVSKSVVRDDVRKAESITGCGDQRELGWWWEENRVDWVLWLMDELGLDPEEVAARARNQSR